MSVIDAATGTVTRTIPVGAEPVRGGGGFRCPHRLRGQRGDSTVSVINAATGTVTRTIPVGSGPGGLAVDPATRPSTWPTIRGTVSVIKAATGTVTGTIPVGAFPSGWRWIPLPAPST